MLDRAATEDAAAWARSGVVALTGHADAAPLVPPGRAAGRAAELMDVITGATGGGSASTVRACWRNGRGHRSHAAGRVGVGGSARLLPTADGWAVVSCARADDVAGGASTPPPRRPAGRLGLDHGGRTRLRTHRLR